MREWIIGLSRIVSAGLTGLLTRVHQEGQAVAGGQHERSSQPERGGEEIGPQLRGHRPQARDDIEPQVAVIGGEKMNSHCLRIESSGDPVCTIGALSAQHCGDSASEICS
ncbi:hypothetical protein MANAM107_12720 [Actinomyces capricornis]|uniref:Secreted protein n=1 Tax=Actinomyces capricornis TaxID=2755559 RepID=A0ABM7UAM3_9ACTO|nr:hypothetical protein MANAM107_12720 [Actinomyces capricornis]